MRAIDAAIQKIFTLHESESIRKAVGLFRQHYLDALPIVDDEGRLCGIFTKSKIYSALLDGIDLDLPVQSMMVQDVFTLRYDDSIDTLGLGSKSQMVVVDDDRRPIGLINKSATVLTLLDHSNVLAQNLKIRVDTMDYGVLNINMQGIVQVFNRSACSMLGKEADQFVGEHISSLFPQWGIERVLMDGQPIVSQRFEWNEHVILVTCRMMDGPAEGLGAIIILQDLTSVETMAQELHSVRQLNRILDTVLQLAFDGITVSDENGRIMTMNRTMCDLIGREDAEVIGKHISEIRIDSAIMGVIGNGIGVTNDIQAIRGSRYAVSCQPIVENGRIMGAVEMVTGHHLKDLKKLVERMEMLEKEIDVFRQEARKTNHAKYTFKQIITTNPMMEYAKREALRIAPSDLPVLLLGESGTGKELFAHSIHNASHRRNAPFIKVNCAAIPDELMESEFFGYEEGAFTGARRKGKPGKFELANGGTLFLDEIGDMALNLQAKLLRVIQDGELERIGGTSPIRVNVRIVTATNTNLEEKVKEGAFRLDLYYRINVFSIRIPALAERREDISLLVNFFINKYNGEQSNAIRGIEKDAIKALCNHKWPGNIRELENAIRRSMYLAGSPIIQKRDLPIHISGMHMEELAAGQETIDAGGHIEIESMDVPADKEELDRLIILQALEETGGNRSKAAKQLGIGRSTLYERMIKLGIPTTK